MRSWLNTDNIRRDGEGIEYHPLIPFLPVNAKVLFLGSFPPQRKRWCIDFYYPNFINDHWRIEGAVFFADRNHFVLPDAKRFNLEAIVTFCQERGIAFFDTATAVRRLKDNAADQYLEVVEPTDLHALLRQLPSLEVIVTTGQKATEVLCQYFAIAQVPKVGASVLIPNVIGTDVHIPNVMDTNVIGSDGIIPNVMDTNGIGSDVLIPNAMGTDGHQVRLHRLPSSSRAYPLSFDKKVLYYKQMFLEAGLL